MKKIKIIKNILLGFILFFAGNIFVFASDNQYIMCGNKAVPEPIPGICRTVVLVLQIILPIMIVILGSLDFVKAVMAADQEKIKANQKQFLNRLKIGLMFFLVITFMKFGVSLFASQTDNGITKCVSCMIDNENECGDVTTNPFSSSEN